MILARLVAASLALCALAAISPHAAFAQPILMLQGDPDPEPVEEDCVTVGPGEKKVHGGVTVDNTGTSGDVVICRTTDSTGTDVVEINADAGSEYDVEDLEPGDVVNVGTNQTANVSGTGGTVNQSASSGHGTVTVPGAGQITLNKVTGTTVYVNSGSGVVGF